ncbi:cytokine-inducible SH2-containing protein [Armigeres subalbatus]|uniref:cytokine-inducible SH2-containing protein n=1 Tax=Armigeres subalbatus TaxID=124917 RepID=UPI002ED49E19
MDEQKQIENIYRFKWFMSLTRKRAPKTEETCNLGSTSRETTQNNGMFFTIRKRFQKLTSVKIKAYEPKQFSTSFDHSSEDRHHIEVTDRCSDNDFARMVLEQHNQNPIKFSSPNVNLPVIPTGSAVPSMIDKNENFGCTDHADGESLDMMMRKVRTNLLKYGWYWGKLTRSAAQKRLARQDNGTFLVRDSETEKHQFAISFRCSGITLHCRIDYNDNNWSFSGLTTPTHYATMVELIEDSMKKSEFDVIGFGKQTSPLTPPFPVRLKKPINRFFEVATLQHMCKFIIQQRLNTNDIAHLPLPSKLKKYIEENL